MTIIYVVDNKMGGVTSLNYNLAMHPLKGTRQTVVHIDQEEWAMSRADLSFPVDEEIHFKYRGAEHSYATLKRLYSVMPKTEGALVLNYENEMAMLDHFEMPQTTYQLVHDDYNVKLAVKYGHVVDVFICHNNTIFKTLNNLLPSRASDIFLLPHGVQIPNISRHTINSETAPVKLLFLGRMAVAKGVHDLPLIAQKLKAKGINAEWTCVGNGPELSKLKSTWADDRVQYLSPATNAEVLGIAAQNDIFVLPTKFEGSPVSLIETMSVGLVPVVSKIPGGITEIVKQDIGYTIEIDDIDGFADAISALATDRISLEQKSINCRAKILEEYDIVNTAKAYHNLFSEYRSRYKKKTRQKIRVGARLDHPIVPAALTLSLRKFRKKK